MNRKEWLIAAILTFITVVAWIVFDIIHTQKQVEISPEVQEVLEPISPDFDTGVVESLP
jgi:hypothetical protein